MCMSATWPRAYVAPRPLVFLFALWLCACQVGCDEEQPAPGDVSTTPTSGSAGAALDDADAILQAMSRAYRDAATYADSGQVRLRYLQGTTPVDVSADFSITFARPNRLRMHVYQAIVVSDGQVLYATIADLPQQVLRVVAPAELSLENLYAYELLNYVLTNGIAGGSIQVALLLEEEALAAITEDGGRPELLEPALIGGQRCYRIKLERSDGAAVFWIDQQSMTLRRFEYPTGELKKHLAAGGAVADLSLVADFHGAKLGGEIDPVAFDFELPSDAKLVETFVHRPEVARPLPPSQLLGKPAPAFSFTALDGAAVTRQSLAGKIVVLDFWFTTCPPCRASMPHLEQVYQRYADNPRVVFLAVSVDDPEVPDEQLRSTLAEWGISVPIARDKTGFAQSGFNIPGAPSMFVIGPDGRVQDNVVGVNPSLTEELPQTIDKLLAGEDTVLLAGQRYDARLAAYRQSLRAAGGGADEAAGVARAEISKRSQPTFLSLTPLWSCTELTEPGNMLTYEEPGRGSRILVMDGIDQVVELDATGQVAARHSLSLPAGAVVNFLRTGVDSDGRRYFAGTAGMQPQVHVFNGGWKTVLSYPAGGSGDAITDVQLADLDGDGHLEINAGFWAAAGVHSVLLDGTRQWQEQSLENVYRLAVSGPDAQGRRGLLCTSGRGNLVPIDFHGAAGSGAYVGGRYLTMIVAGDVDGDGREDLCGLSRNQAGVETAIGVSHDYDESWNYPLPFGAHQNPIEPITSGRLLSGAESQWLLAGADGSIHILSADGRPVDRFNYGAELTGLAVAQIDGSPVLLISTRSGVDVWSVEAPATE